MENTLNYSKISNVVVSNIDMEDYPKFCDANISAAKYEGRPMTDAELDILNEDMGFINECVIKQIF